MSKSILFCGLSLCVLLTASSFAQAQEYVPGEIIVKIRRDQGDSAQSASEKSSVIARKLALSKGLTHRKSWNRFGLHQFRGKPNSDIFLTIRELKSDPSVEYAEPNYIVRQASTSGFFDTMTSSEVQAQASANGIALTSANIQSSDAWAILSSSTSQTPVVAVIDTGLDVNHEVIAGTNALWTNSDEVPNNGIDDDANGYVDDVHGWNFVDGSGTMYDDDGHGTHVTGIVLGTTQDIYAATLTPAKIKIMPLKFLDGSGSGTTSDAIEAIYYAVNNGAKVLNNSWGGANYSAALHEAIAYSYEQKTLFVAAAGNSGTDNDASPMYPASYDVPNIVSTAATRTSDYLASFSNFGDASVHLGSPGVSIFSMLPSCPPNVVVDCDYGSASGTSMATPFVSGVAALMLYESPSMSGYQLRQLLLNGTDYIAQLVNRVSTDGRLNTLGSVQLAKTTAPSASQPDYNLKLETADRELASDIASGGGCGTVAKMGSDMSSNFMDGPPPMVIVFAVILALMPLMYLLSLRMRNTNASMAARRRYERFKIDTSVTIKVGEKELIGNVSTISLGGMQLNTDALLEKGGKLQLRVMSPDGQEEVTVLGEVVWSEAQKTYGIKFAEPSRSVLSHIEQWTRSLIKT